MPQPNIAREPSMDEILASIRKIIESNEPGLPGFPANDLGHAPQDGYRSEAGYDSNANDIELTIDDDMLVAEFAADMQMVEPVQENHPAERQPEAVKPAAPQSTPPLSLADVAARVRAASERNASPPRDENQVAAARAVVVQPDAAPQAETAIAAAAPNVPTHGVETVAVEPGAVEMRGPDGDAESRPAMERKALAVTESAQAAEKDVAALVSPAVGEQVARSFDNLALAVDSSARRSFDEIAEDMLRPMLQEWLDDNLPTLVERLVREEIERVARGPRR